MTLGDGIRRNIASVDPTERALLRDALIELNQRFFPGNRTDQPIPGGVSWWFKQDEIHQATHVHGGPEFVPWHREIVNRLEGMLRQINPQLSLHYWDWTQDPRAIPNANLGGGVTGTLNLFTPDFMGYGGPTNAPIGEPWLSAGYYVPGAINFRSTDESDPVNNNPADPPRVVDRSVSGSPASVADDTAILSASDYAQMSGILEAVHGSMHGFVNMGGRHTSFRDPFVFLLHSNVERLFALWQTDPAHPERLASDTVYGSLSGDAGLNSNIRPWSGMPLTVRPFAPPENEQVVKTYKDPSVVTPPRYDTNLRIVIPVTLQPGVYTIQQRSNGRFVDAHEHSGKDFGLVTRLPQNNDTQKWVLMHLGNNVYTIQQLSNSRFVAAHSPEANKDFAVVTRKGLTNDTQRWILRRSGDSFTLQQKNSGRFMDAHEIEEKDFALVTRPEQNDLTQKWILTPVSVIYTIQQLSNGRFVAAHSPEANKDFAAVTRKGLTNDTQRWILRRSGDSFTLQQKSSGRFMDAHEIEEKDFALVTRPEQNSDFTQRWIIRSL